MYILGVRIDNISKEEIFEKIEKYLSEPRFRQIATVNPEFILEAQNNLIFKAVINCCSLNIADGFGITLAFWRYGKHLKYRMPGTDLMEEILRLADRKRLKLFLAVDKDGLSAFEEIRQTILKKYPDLTIEGADLDKDTDSCSAIDKHDILFSNFGAPHQETFLNCQKNGTIRLAMGVGGGFDFLTGKTRRAPRFMRQIGLEWLWRAIQPQPWKFKIKRLKRIRNAIVIFPLKILFKK